MTIPVAFVTIEFRTYMTTMHRALLAVLLLSGIVIAQSQIVAAQTQPTLSTRPAAKPAAKAASVPAAVPTVLPTEDTVNSFLFQTFGYDPTITWKVMDIRPSEIAGLARSEERRVGKECRSRSSP